MTEPFKVVTSREVRTETGVIPAGTTLLAVPAVDGGWQLNLPTGPRRVPTQCVVSGKTLLDSVHAHDDYRFARDTLGLSHVRALAWIREGYETTEKRLERWGFTNLHTNVREAS